MTGPIRFIASVAKVQTLADGGIRVTLDLPESAIMQMAELAAIRVAGVPLEVQCRPHEQSGELGFDWDFAEID